MKSFSVEGAWFKLIHLFSCRPASPRQARVAITTAAGNIATFKADIAGTLFRRARGMMGREEIPASSGMLIVYPRPHIARIWMAGTPAALDVIFADANGRIVKVAAALEAFSKRVVSSESRVKWVLEIAAGEAARLGISVGATLEPASTLPACTEKNP